MGQDEELQERGLALSNERRESLVWLFFPITSWPKMVWSIHSHDQAAPSHNP
jgi:hypothetical protein